jgi:drug/metabolite transporter (DMT)-like permease
MATHPITSTVGAIGTTLAATVGSALGPIEPGPISEVFNELGLVLAIMGALGGATFSIANRRPYREISRGVILGALIAFGLGAISPIILEKMIGIEPTAGAASVPLLAGAAYFIGFAQETFIAWSSRLKKGDSDAG